MNKQFIPVILFLCGAIAAIAGMLMLCLTGLAFKITGGVLIFVGVYVVGVGVFMTYKMKVKREDNKTAVYEDYGVLKKQNPASHEGNITAICQDDTVRVNVWGEERELKVSTRRIMYSAEQSGAGTLFNAEEIALLNEVTENGAINGDEVKAAVLKYVNEVTAEWDDDYYDGKITSVAPPEVEIKEIIIDNVNEAQPEVLFCGEALCDAEHGIVIAFEDGKFSSVGSYGDFL